MDISPSNSESHMSAQESVSVLSLLVAAQQRDTIPALTFTDPWGSLVASGAKRIETRSWATPYRGPLAIHIAKTLPLEAEVLCGDEPFCQALEAAGYSWTYGLSRNPWKLPLGCVVALVRVEQVQPIAPGFLVDEQERAFGNYTPGRFAWHFSQVYRLREPLPARGALGMWRWTPPARLWQEIQSHLDMERTEASS